MARNISVLNSRSLIEQGFPLAQVTSYRAVKYSDMWGQGP